MSKVLGFTVDDQSTKVRSIGFVALEGEHCGIAICAAIAPYRAYQEVNRGPTSAGGGYVEVFVNAPLEFCEERDANGLYAKARAGFIEDFMGIDDMYEEPWEVEVVFHTERESMEQCTRRVLDCTRNSGYIPPANA